jgi:coenzyme F420-reducing hydrogenase delta subunit
VNANRRVTRVQELLSQIGLEPERIRMFYMSSAMAEAFANAATEMTELISTVGPSPLRIEKTSAHLPKSEINHGASKL